MNLSAAPLLSESERIGYKQLTGHKECYEYNIKNRKGVNMHPCGTPATSALRPDNKSSNITFLEILVNSPSSS